MNIYEGEIKKRIECFIEKLVGIEPQFEKQIDTYKLMPFLMKIKFVILLKSILLLEINEMRQASSIIVRSLYEILIDFLYCETDPKNLYSRFKEYASVSRVKMTELLNDDEKEGINMEDYTQITIPEYEKFKIKYNIIKDNQLYNWSGKKIGEKIMILKKEYNDIENLHKKIYKFNCTNSHLDSNQLIKSTFKIKNNYWELNYSDTTFKNGPLSVIVGISEVANIFLEIFEKKYNN